MLPATGALPFVLPAAAAPILPLFGHGTEAAAAANEEKWRLQVQALTIAPMELRDFHTELSDFYGSDAVMENLSRIQHPYLGCLLLDRPVIGETQEEALELKEAIQQVLRLGDVDSRQFRPFPRLSALERSFLQAEAFGKSTDSVKGTFSIPFILNIPQEVCKLRYRPPSKPAMNLDIPSPPLHTRQSDPQGPDQHVYVQKITLVKKNENHIVRSFFEVETNYYKRGDGGSENIVHENDLVIFSRPEAEVGVAATPAGALSQAHSFSADSATFCLDRTYSLSSVREEKNGAFYKTVVQIEVPDSPLACDYRLLGTVHSVEYVQTVDEDDEVKCGPYCSIHEDPPYDPKCKKSASRSNLLIKFGGDQPPLPSSSGADSFALFYIDPEHEHANPDWDNLKDNHSFTLGWLHKIHKFKTNSKDSHQFQIEPFFMINDCLSPYYNNAVQQGKLSDPSWEYNLYRQLKDKRAPKGLKVVLIPGPIVLMPLFFKPESIFIRNSGNARELQLSPDKECFAIVAGVQPNTFNPSTTSLIHSSRAALIKHFKSTGMASRDVAIDPLAVLSFLSNGITDPAICCMLLSCCEDIAAVLGCRKKSKKAESKRVGLPYALPDQINTLWKLYGTGLAVEAFNRLAQSSKAFRHPLNAISQQEVIDVALTIHFVERVGSIFEIQQRVLLQCFDVMEVYGPLDAKIKSEVPVPSFSKDQANSLLKFLACVKREVFTLGVREIDDRSIVDGVRGKNVFRMPQNISKIIRKFLRMNPPFHKAKCSRLISEVVFKASTALSLVSRFIKQFTVRTCVCLDYERSCHLCRHQSPQFFALCKIARIDSQLSPTDMRENQEMVKTSCRILQQCDQTAYEIQHTLIRPQSRQHRSDPVVYNSYFLQMSITVLVGAMVDFVSPLRYCPINSRPFASDSDRFNLSTPTDLEHVRVVAENFRFRIEYLQEVKSQCDRLKHIKLRKIDQSASNVSSQRACYFGLVDVALHACWYSMCKRSEERCKYNIPQNSEWQSYPFETYCPRNIDGHDGVCEYEETPQIVERWSSGFIFLNKVMLPSLAMCSDPSSKAIRVCVVSSICNFLNICASLDPALFKFLFIRDVVADHHAHHASKVSVCHLLLEAAASCIDLEPEVSLSVHNKAVRIDEEEEELDDEERCWFPFGLLYQNFKAHLEPDSDLFCMARLSSAFRLMKSLCSLSLLSAGTPMVCPMDTDAGGPPSMYDIYHLEVWLNWMHNLPSEDCPIKSYLQDDDAEDNQYFTDPFFLICYMMICQESSDIKSLPRFQNDRQAAEDFYSNHFIKVCPLSHGLHTKKNSLLAQYFKDQLEVPVNNARDFAAQLLKEITFDRESEDFKVEFQSREFNHERMVTNWIDFLSAFVELNSKKLSCPHYEVSQVDHDELERLENTLHESLSVRHPPTNERIFDHMQKHFANQDAKVRRCTRWNQMIDGNRPPSSVSELERLSSSQHHQHPLHEHNGPSDASAHKGGVCLLSICVSFWMFPYTTTPVKTSLVRYLRCHLDSVHRYHQYLSDQNVSSDERALGDEKTLKEIKELATKKCRWLFCIEGQQEPPAGDPPVISAIDRDFEEKEWSHTIELLKLLRIMLIFEVQHFEYIVRIVDCLHLKLKGFLLSDDDTHHVMSQRFEVLTCFANILADLCESFDPADFFVSHQEPGKTSSYCKFRYAILRRVCTFQSNQEPLCCLFLRILSLISRHAHYVQLMPAALASCRLLLTAHERQKELGNLRAGDKFICRPFEDDSLDSFEAIMISNMAVPYLLCAAGHMEIRTLPALALFMSCLHPNNFNSLDDKSEHTDDADRMNRCSHRIFLTFPKQLCSWASSSTLRSLSDSVLLLSSSLLLLSRILEDAAQSIPNSSHGILSQVMSTAAMHSSHRCGPALSRIDQTLAFVVQTLLEPDGSGFFIFHSHLMVRHDQEHPIEDDFYDLHQSPLIYTWILNTSGSALSTSSGRLSKFLSCQSIVHRNILIGDYFCKFSFRSDPGNAFGTFHPFNLQLFDRKEAHDDIFQKLMDVGTERSHENVKENFSSSANTFVNFIALVRALACVSVNSICDILRTCPPKTDSSQHAPSLAHILLNQHAMYSHSIVDDSSFVVSKHNYRASRLLLSLLSVVKGFWTNPSEIHRFENLNKRMVWLLPIISRSWEVIATLLDDPFSRLLCAHVIQISRDSGEAWLWGSGGEFNIEAGQQSTSLSALIDCASFLDYFLKMNSSLDPSVDSESGVDLNYVYSNQLHDLHSHSVHAIAWSIKALTSMVWIITTLCPERFSYDLRDLFKIWRWAETMQVWNRSFCDNIASDDVSGPDVDDGMSIDRSITEPAGPTLESSIRHVVNSRSNFYPEQQLFELLLRCQNNEFDNVVVEMGRRVPWFISRLQNWYFFEDRLMLGELLAAGARVLQTASLFDLPKEWENIQSKASRFNVSLLSRPGADFRWNKSSHDPFRIIDRSKLELVFNALDTAQGASSNQEAFKSISLHALHFNHALSLKSSKCHLAQALGSFFPVIFRAPPSSTHFDMELIYKRDEVSTCVIFIDFALRMCLFLRDWLVTHQQADFTLRFFKAARSAIFRLKGLPNAAKESFLDQNRPLFLKISENISQIIISKSSTVNQAAVLERQELYKLLLEYLAAFQENEGGDFVLQHVLCSDDQRYLPLAFYTILRDVADANSFQSIEAMLLLALLLRLVPPTLAIVNVVASRTSFCSPLIDFVEGPLSQSPLFSSVFHARCSLLSRIAHRNPSLIAPVIVAMRDSPFFVKKGTFFSVISSQQHAQQTVATFADQVIAFHLVANSFMCTIFRCASVLDTLLSYSASEGLLELLHFLHASFYNTRSEDSVQVEHWLLRLLRHFAGSRDPYLDYLVRRRACLPAPFMRPFSSFATALYEQINAAVLSLAVLQRHRVRSWTGATPWLRVFNVADKEIPQLLVNSALFDVSVAGVECFDILELPRDRFAQGDVDYDGMMAVYQMRLDILLHASIYCRHLPAECQPVSGQSSFQFLANFDAGLFMALNNLQPAQALHGATIPHVRHLFEICYKLTWSIKKSHDTEYPINQSDPSWQPRADIGLRNKFRAVMLVIVENLCDCVIQLLLAHAHLRLDRLVNDPESGYITIALDMVKRAMICARDCVPSAFDSLHSLHLALMRIRFPPGS